MRRRIIAVSLKDEITILISRIETDNSLVVHYTLVQIINLVKIKMAETKKEQMLKKLEDLKLIKDMPKKLYLANHFQELRNKVDLEMFSKQILYINDNEMKNVIDQIWKEMIRKLIVLKKSVKIKMNCN